MYSASLTLLLAPGAFAASRCNDINSVAAQKDYDAASGWRTAPTHGEYHGGCCQIDVPGCCNSQTCAGASCNALPPLPDHADADAMQACIGQPSGHKCPLKCLPGYTPKSINLPQSNMNPSIRPSPGGPNVRFPLYTCSDGDWGLGWDDSGGDFYHLHIEPGHYTGANINGEFHANKLQGHESWGGSWNRLADFDWTLDGGKIHRCVALDTLPEYHTGSVDQWSYRCQTYYPEATYPGFCPRDHDGNQQQRNAPDAGDWTMPWLDQVDCPVGYGPITSQADCTQSCTDYYSIQQNMVDLWCAPGTDHVNNPHWYQTCGGLNWSPWTTFAPYPEFTYMLTGYAAVCANPYNIPHWPANTCIFRGGEVLWNTGTNLAFSTEKVVCKKLPGPPVACQKDDSQFACENFESDSDFATANDGPGFAVFTNTLPIDASTLVIGNGPWENTNTIAQQTSSGCLFTQATSTGTPSATEYGTPATGSLDCTVTQTTACSPTAAGQAAMALKYSMAEIVANLDNTGALAIYYHRIVANPITGNNLGLLWIAQNACKIKVDVEFQCTGGNCVEVTTIVCASFAGITSGNKGSLRIECKVPPGWDMSNVKPTTAADASSLIQEANLVVAENTNLFANDANGNALVPTKQFGAGTAGWQYVSDVDIGASSSVVGTVTVTASVSDTSFTVGATSSPATSWTDVQDIYVANYNLTRASTTLDPLIMPVAANFYTDKTSSTLADLATAGAFPSSLTSGPFLSRQTIEHGGITHNVHGFIRVIAKVVAPNHWFKDLHVTQVKLNGAVDAALKATCHTGTPSETTGVVLEASEAHDTNSYPLATIKCENFIAASTTAATPNVAAGDTVVLSLKWKLRKFQTSSGKAQLLQEAAGADPADQSVEIELAISVGQASTEVTVGGQAGDGADSANNTTTYIIIAVAVIAVALLVAALVVAWLCLRQRQVENLQAMSPAKATVAAVYEVNKVPTFQDV